MQLYENLNILTVEDDQDTASLIKLLLERDLSSKVVIANDCATARRELTSRSFDLVTLDYQLPDGDGLTLLEEINSLEEPPPVVLITGHGDERTALDSFKLGGSGYVIKDNRMRTLLVEEARSALARRCAEKTSRALFASETALRESRSRMVYANQVMAGILEHTDMLTALLDSSFNFIWVNKAYAQAARHDPSYFPGRNHFELYPHSENQEIFQRVVDTGEAEYITAKPFEYPDQPELGVTYWDWSLIPVEDDAGAIGALVLTLSEVTDRELAFMALRESEETVSHKLKAILEPEGDLAELALAEIIDSREIQSLMDDFFQLTNIGVAIIDLSGAVLVATGWQEICTKFHRVNPETGKFCLESDIELSRGVAPGDYTLYKCKNQMWDMATPIMIGDQHVGNLFLGQFFFAEEAVDTEAFREQARRYGFDEDSYLSALERVPRWSRETVDAVMSFYAKLTALLSSLSHGRIMLARTLEQQKELLAERERNERELLRANEELEAYAQSASHDLKSPLSTISAVAQMLCEELEDTDNTEVAEMLDLLKKSAGNAHRLVSDLLRLAESRQHPHEVEDIEVRELLSEILATFSFDIQQRKAKVVVDEDLGAIRANRTQIRQVFSNLVSNALKHCDADKPEIFIRQLPGENSCARRYLVRDNGSGVPEDQLDAIFVPFYKGPGTGETGLGLPIASKIVGVYGGAIRAWNDSGACFEFTVNDWGCEDDHTRAQ